MYVQLQESIEETRKGASLYRYVYNLVKGVHARACMNEQDVPCRLIETE